MPGVVPLVLGRVHDLTPPDAAIRTRAWSIATVAFAAGQAIGAYGFAALFDFAESHAPLFAFGAGMLFLALAIDMFIGVFAARNGHLTAKD